MRFSSNTYNHFLTIALLTIACTHALPIARIEKDLHASFVVPCIGCSPASFDPLFLFDFAASHSDTPCGSTDVTLNGQPLTPSVIVEQEHLQGRTSVESSGQQLGLIWSIDCLRGRPKLETEVDSNDDAQVITVQVVSVNDQILPSLAGFTLSFRSSGDPSLLRLDNSVVKSITTGQEADSWRVPPSSLQVTIGGSTTSAAYIQSELVEIRRIELELQSLNTLYVERKKALVDLVSATHLLATTSSDPCKTLSCFAHTAISEFHALTTTLFSDIKHHSSVQSSIQALLPADTTEVQQTGTNNMMQGPAAVGPYAVPTLPAAAHFSDGQKSDLPYINEKTGGIITSESLEASKSEFSQGRGFLASIIKFILIVTGLAALYRLFTRRLAKKPASLRKLRDQAARREETRAARAYRRSARRQALHDWWHGHRRNTCGNTRACEEKSNLVRQQEGILEEEMQNEIRQLAIQEQTRRMRLAFEAGDELIRAEEGLGGYARSIRSTSSRRHPILPPYSYNATNTQQIMGFTPIHIQAGISTTHPTGSSYAAFFHRDFHPQPLSRTSSLPDYRSEAAFSDPPSYHTYDTDRDNFTDTDDDSGSTYDSIGSPRSQFSFDQPSMARSAYIVGGHVVRDDCPGGLEQRGVARDHNGLGSVANDSLTTIALERTFI